MLAGPLRRAGLLGRLPLREVVRLIRPRDTAIAGVACLLGAKLLGLDRGWTAEVIWVTVSNMLLLGGSMALNDWHDIEEDAVNRPDAPVVSGAVDRRQALQLGVLFLALAVAAGLVAGVTAALLAVAFVVLSAAYTLRLKRVPLVGNALVALLSSYAFWCWMLIAWSTNRTYLLLSGCLFLFCLGRELLGAARDRPGDSNAGVRTVATVLGERSTRRVAASLIAIAGAFAWGPLLMGTGSGVYGSLLSLSWLLVLWLAMQAFLPLASPLSSGALVVIARLITAVMAVAFALGISPGPP